MVFIMSSLQQGDKARSDGTVRYKAPFIANEEEGG